MTELQKAERSWKQDPAHGNPWLCDCVACQGCHSPVAQVPRCRGSATVPAGTAGWEQSHAGPGEAPSPTGRACSSFLRLPAAPVRSRDDVRVVMASVSMEPASASASRGCEHQLGTWAWSRGGNSLRTDRGFPSTVLLFPPSRCPWGGSRDGARPLPVPRQLWVPPVCEESESSTPSIFTSLFLHQLRVCSSKEQLPDLPLCCPWCQL